MQEGLDKGNQLLAVWDALRDVWSVSGQSMATVVTGSVIVAEIWRLTMVLAGFVRKRLDGKLKKEGREELAAESEEWLKRRDEAQEKGEPFDEEPPWRDNGASES